MFLLSKLLNFPSLVFLYIISFIKNPECIPANWECPLGNPKLVAGLLGQLVKYPQSVAFSGLLPWPKIGILSLLALKIGTATICFRK